MNKLGNLDEELHCPVLWTWCLYSGNGLSASYLWQFVGWQSYRPVLSWDLALRWQCQFRSQCTLLFSLHNCTCLRLSKALHIHLALLHCSGQIGSSTVQQVWTSANHLSQSKGQTQWPVLLYSSGIVTVAIPELYCTVDSDSLHRQAILVTCIQLDFQ